MTEKDGMREKKNRWGMRKRWVILAVVLLAAEVSLRLLYSPMRFTAFLLLCAAALSLVWGFLEARRARKPFRIARRGAAGPPGNGCREPCAWLRDSACLLYCSFRSSAMPGRTRSGMWMPWWCWGPGSTGRSPP